MRDKVKRFISILMTALMLVNLMPVGALADGITSGGYKPEVAESTGYYKVYVYARFSGTPLPGVVLNASQWYTIGYIDNVHLPSPDGRPWYTYYNNNEYCGPTVSFTENGKRISTSASGIIGGLVQEYNKSIVINPNEWISANFKACPGADTYKEGTHEPTWHLDIIVDINKNPPVHNLVFKVNNTDGKQIGTPQKVTGKWTNPLSFNTYTKENPVPDTIIDGGIIYKLKERWEGNQNLGPTKIYFNEPIKNVEFYYKEIGYVTRNYTVNYYLNGTEEKVKDKDPITGTAALGETVTPDTNVSGYTLVPGQKTSLTIVDGDNVLNLYYYKNVELTANSATKTYNGSEQNVSGFTGAPEDADFSDITVGATRKDVGTYNANFPKNILNTVDATGKYIVTDAINGTLTISKRKVTLTSGSASKVYDGTALTNDKVTVGGDGFAKGEGATYRVTGSQTVVGSSENTFGYKLNGNTNAANYEIKTENGTLKVTPVTDAVTVTITGNKVTEKYDGTKKTAKDYTVSISNEKYTEDDFTFSGTAKVEKTDAGNYPMGLKVSDFTNNNANFTDVTFIVEDGSLTISKRKVTLTSASDEKVYDGNALTNGTVTVSDDGFADGEGATYEVTGSQTDVGSSENTFGYKLNGNTNAANYEIKTENGTLKVTPVTDAVTVTITGNKVTEKYDGTKKTAKDYTVSISNEKYTEDDFTFSGTAKVEKTDAGNYPMGLKVSDFTNNNANFTDVTFIVEDGSLTISKRKVTLTSASDEKVYDGNALTNGTVTVSDDGFADGEGATYDVTGSQTVVGSSENKFTYKLKNGTNADNYDIKTENGTLTVTAVTAKVTVTIKGHKDTKPYNGKEQSVTGYDVSISAPDGVSYTTDDFTFSGTAEAKGTNAREASYPMGLTESQFTNTSKNFTNVEFVVTDGGLTISKREVNLSSGTVSKTYDGTPLTSDMVTIEGDGFIEEEAWDVEAIGSVKDVSEGEVTNTITYKTSDKFKEGNYNITKTEGKLKITPRNVTLTSASDSKEYDGTPLTKKEVNVTRGSFAKGEGATYNVTGTVTEVKDSPAKNTFTYTLNGNTKAENYNIELVLGTLTITPVETEVVVTITGRTDEMPYDGKEHSVSGYDVTVSNELYKPKEDMRFNGTDVDMTAKGTDAGTYPMELTAEDFTNKSDNFSKVTFVVTDGYVKINPRAVTLTSETAGKTYDGTALEKPAVTVGGDGFVDGEVKDIKATGSVTNAGSVANTITFTPNKETFKEGNYAITKTEGTLTIAKRSVLISSQSATKTYDGEALTRPAVTITGDGFVPGELAKAEATGSITKVGSTPNTIQYTTTGVFNAANYSIALSVGTLTVTEKPQPEPRRTFNLTINYVYQNGKRAASSYNRGGLKNGETFDITSPVIAGYTASETVVSGTIYNRDIKVTVIYTADGVNLDDYGVPLGLGNITMNVGDCFE